MSEPSKMPARVPESYSPKNLEIADMMDELCAERIVDSIVLEGVLFQVIEKGRTFYAGAYAVEPDEIEPGTEYSDDSNLMFKGGETVGEVVDAVVGGATPAEHKLFLWIDYESADRPCAMLYGREAVTGDQPEGVHVVEAEPTYIIKVGYNHASWALTKKLTGRCVHQYQMTELFGLIRQVFCEGEDAEFEYNGDNGTGNFDAEHFIYREQYYGGEFIKYADADKYVTVPVKRRSGYEGHTAQKYWTGRAVPIARPIAPRTTEEIDAMQEPPGDFSKIRLGGYDWLVLAEEGGKALLLSEKVILFRRFHHSNEQITWAECELREYLNGEFYNELSEEERKLIVETTLPPYENPWYGASDGRARLAQLKGKSSVRWPESTDDRVFILSVEEVVKYLGDSGDLENRVGLWATMEDMTWRGDGMGQCLYDRHNTARIAEGEDGVAEVWSTRTPGYQYHYIVPVLCNGTIGPFTGGGVDNPAGIRPAMWVRV